MNKIVVDSLAWIEYLSGSEKGRAVKEYIANEQVRVFATGMIVTEVCTKILKEEPLKIEEIMDLFRARCVLVEFDYELGREASEIFVMIRKTREKFGLVDAHILAAARKVGGKVLTCDTDFSGMSEAIVLR